LIPTRQIDGRRFKFGPYPDTEVDHDHCPECNTPLYNRGPGDFTACYYYYRDEAAGYAESAKEFAPAVMTDADKIHWLMEIDAICADCFPVLAKKYDWSVVGEDQPVPIYPGYDPGGVTLGNRR
jgi:hypothetical protein